MPQQQQLGDGQCLAALAHGVLAQRVRRRGAVVERQLFPDGLLHDPAVLARRVTVHVQRVHRPAVAVPDQLQVDRAPVIVGQHVAQVRVADGRPLRYAAGANLMAMSAHWRCGRMNAAESGSRRSSSASTAPGVYPRSAQSRLIFHFRLISSGGSRYTVMSKQALASLVCSGNKPSTITNSRGSTSTGRTSEPVEWSYTGLRTGRPSASNCRCCSITSM